MEWIELEGNCNAGTSVAILMQLRERHSRPLNVIWDDTPAHRGEAVREYLRVPGLGLQLVNLPGYGLDFNSDDATGNLRLGSTVMVQEKVGNFLSGMASRSDEVKRRCRTVLQLRAEGVLRDSQPNSEYTRNAHPTLALV